MESNSTPGSEPSLTQPQSSAEVAAAAEAANKASVELFELCAAILLGLGATLGSIAGYQGGLWGGKSVESFGKSATVTTKSADEGTFADSQISSDGMVKMQIMQLVSRAKFTPKGDERDLLLYQASELMLREYTSEAYEYLGLPDEPREKYDDKGVVEELSEDEIFEAAKKDFHKPYFKAMYEDKVKYAIEARELFEQGQHEGTVGDQFALDGVYYTMSLFFAGLGLVFKSRVRWGFFGLGTAIFFFALIYMCRLDWA